MFDKLIFQFFQWRHKHPILAQVDYSVDYYGDITRKDVTLIFTHWHSTKAAAERIVRKLGKNKPAIVVRMNSALSLDPHDVLKQHLKLRAEVDSIIRKRVGKLMRIISVSIGNIHVGYFADTFEPDYVDLVTPGITFADSFWHGLATRSYKQHYVKNGIRKHTLDLLWRELAIKKYSNFMFNQLTKVRMWGSESDKLIPYRFFQEILVVAEHSNQVDFFSNKHLGHYLTLLKVWYFWKPNE